MAFNQFPYTNLHELNDDWLLKTVKEAATDAASAKTAAESAAETVAGYNSRLTSVENRLNGRKITMIYDGNFQNPSVIDAEETITSGYLLADLVSEGDYVVDNSGWLAVVTNISESRTSVTVKMLAQQVLPDRLPVFVTFQQRTIGGLTVWACDHTFEQITALVAAARIVVYQIRTPGGDVYTLTPGYTFEDNALSALHLNYYNTQNPADVYEDFVHVSIEWDPPEMLVRVSTNETVSGTLADRVTAQEGTQKLHWTDEEFTTISGSFPLEDIRPAGVTPITGDMLLDHWGYAAKITTVSATSVTWSRTADEAAHPKSIMRNYPVPQPGQETVLACDENGVAYWDNRGLYENPLVVTFSGTTASGNAVCDRTWTAINNAILAGRLIVARWRNTSGEFVYLLVTYRQGVSLRGVNLDIFSPADPADGYSRLLCSIESSGTVYIEDNEV